MAEHLTIEEATIFFGDYFFGENHIPDEIKRYGNGAWRVACKTPMATSDYDELTRLVVMAHDRCIRVEIVPNGMNRYFIAIWKRSREGGLMESHPTMEDAVKRIRAYKKYV